MTHRPMKASLLMIAVLAGSMASAKADEVQNGLQLNGFEINARSINHVRIDDVDLDVSRSDLSAVDQNQKRVTAPNRSIELIADEGRLLLRPADANP